jgi:amino acid adenylation domain-containing protein
MGQLRDHLEEGLRRHAGRTALYELSGATLSYGDLDGRSAQIAAALPPVRPGTRRAVCLPKGFDAVAAIFGIIRSGAAYLPLDFDAPDNRNTYILEDARVSELITTPERAALLAAGLPGQVSAALRPGDSDLVICRFDWMDDLPVEAPEDLAYILYTSGSTGRPKGVMITDDNAWSFIDWAAGAFALNETDIVSSIAPFHFDLSVFDLYAALTRGAATVLIDAASAKNPMLLSELIDRFAITVWYATPTTLKMMLRFGRMDRYSHSSLRTVLFAGEVFPVEPLNSLRRRWNHASFHNLYGPTETNVCTWYSLPAEVDEAQREPFPIGKACPFATCYIENEGAIQPATPGLEGELLVGGRSVMAGYLNQPERNAAAFLALEDDTLYRTGDIVRVDQHGQILYVSRRDRMVKRNGYRIELGEIEAALHRHQGISEAGAISTTGPAGEVRILAYYSTRDQAPLETLPLQEHMGGQIPSYMWPDQYLHLAEIPKTSTHKVDYPALAQIA